MSTSSSDARAVAVAQAPHDAEVEVVVGETVEAIERAAEDENADLVVVGSNDKGFLQRLLGGSRGKADLFGAQTLAEAYRKRAGKVAARLSDRVRSGRAAFMPS